MNNPRPETTPEQVGMMRNALGLLYAKVPYRNHFVVPYEGPTRDAWDDLVEKGLAVSSALPIKDREPGRPWRYYGVSDEGLSYLDVRFPAKTA